MRPRKVCFLEGTPYSVPLDRTARKKFVALRRLADVSVIGFSTGVRPRRVIDVARFYLVPRLGIPVVRYVLLLAGGILLALWCVVRRDVQILIAQSPYEGLAAVVVKQSARMLLRRRLAVIIESHGDFEESLFLQRRMVLRGIWRYVMDLSARIALRHADAVRAVSSSTGHQLEALAPGTPLVRFPTWTDLEAFLHVGDEERRKRSDNIVLYAGGITPLKGVDCLIHAASLVVRDVADMQVRIVGSSANRRYADELRSLVYQLGLQDTVSFSESVDQVRLAGYMSEARVLVLPSKSEGLPRIVFEAMATGLPVIATAVSGIPELITDGETGFLVRPDDSRALADRIRWILRHPVEAAEMGRRARIVAREVFSIDLYLEGYRRLLDIADAKLQEPGAPAL